MRTERIKAVMIALLVVANIITASLIAVNFKNRDYYDKKTVEEAYRVIEDGGMEIARGILESKKESFFVYTGGIYASLYGDVIAVYGEFEGSTAGDVSIKSAEGRLILRADGTFSYTKDGESVRELDTERLPDVTDEGRIRKNVEKTAEAFIKADALSSCPSNRESAAKVTYELLSVHFDAEARLYIATYYQSFDGVRASQGGARIAVRDAQVICAEGELSFIYPSERGDCDSTDVLNIIFSEKAHLEAIGKSEMTLTEITYFYRVYDSAAGKRYFIPMCRVDYDDDEFYSVYNLISGKRE